MNGAGIKNLGDRSIAAALTDEVITAASLSGASVEYIGNLADIGSATFFVDFDYGSGGTTCVVVIQTSVNQGEDWIDVARFDFAQVDRKAVATVSAAPSDVAAIAALAAEGIQNGILGDRLRAKVTSTGTYAGTSVSVRAAVREASAADQAEANAALDTLATAPGTVAAGTVGVSSGSLLAADASRKVVLIQNVSASAIIAARSGASAALNTAGNFMAGPNGYIVFEGDAAAAAIHAISDTASTPVTTAVG